jgi:hypothetical protein
MFGSKVDEADKTTDRLHIARRATTDDHPPLLGIAHFDQSNS